MANSDATDPVKLTNTSSKVEGFLFSPDFRYLAYAKIVEEADEPGLWDDTTNIPKKNICSIVILNLRDNRIVREIMGRNFYWIYMERWMHDMRLMYHSSDGFAVSGEYIYDPETDSVQELDVNVQHDTLHVEYSYDGSMKTYLVTTGRGASFRYNLHLENITTGTDTVLVSTKDSIGRAIISHDGKRLTFFMVEDRERTYFDVLWLYDLSNSSCDSIYGGPAHSKEGFINHLAWSPDDRYVGMFFTPDALVLDVTNVKTIINIHGTDFSWLDNDRVLFCRENNIHVYNLRSDSTATLLKGATKPVVLWKF